VGDRPAGLLGRLAGDGEDLGDLLGGELGSEFRVLALRGGDEAGIITVPLTSL